jgi:hypothetical protein
MTRTGLGVKAAVGGTIACAIALTSPAALAVDINYRSFSA